MTRHKKNGASNGNLQSHDGVDVAAKAAREALLAAEHQRAFDMAAETLTGDLRDFILDRLRYEQDKLPWDKRSESDQQMTVSAVESAVRNGVTRAVEIIAAKGQSAIKATLTQVLFKDGIKASIELAGSEPMRHVLADATGGQIVIFVADPEVFEGEREPVKITPDQGELDQVMVQHSDEDADRHENPLN